MPNRTVYLPDGIDAEAKAAGVNLSQILQRALRTELDKMNKMAMATTTAERVAARLAGQPSLDDEGRSEGFDAGRAWATNDATRVQLETLAGTSGPGHSFVRIDVQDMDIYRDGQEVRSLDHADPWSVGFLKGVHAVWAEVEALLD